MSPEPTLRPVEPEDAPRIEELVESSMTASYALSPQDIEMISESVFDADLIRERINASETIIVLAELDDVVAGIVEASLDDDKAEIRWLHVDPERRGAGVGTALFERIQSALADEGIEEPRAVTLAANTSAGSFFERFGFEQLDERTTDIGGRETVEYVFVEQMDGETNQNTSSADASGADQPSEIPETAPATDGTELHLGGDPFQGTEGWFVETFSDADRSEQYGYYCLNCRSADVTMDNMERVRCGDCGNTRKPNDDYDGAYL
ncbi:GNAT family N-acetyltransferase [Haloarcula nitratireducens]|uniref:GNAT family N-acetyltransferase n=1 Tax=Haloarcula nitratireducens TaxID=2487749 RepID=A0AAW4PFJ9_9EURY|nr:GNAT family N-acetyltransferase [Halomicroarcula nitratireducens]MBX0296724.1 GNAT family N-acetyltransferase [Halomicroarcula nitratireducens]